VRRGLAAQLARRERLLAEGARPLGWKLGFGAPPAMEKLGTAAPLVGFLTSRSLLDGDTASVAGWVKPLLEPEIAVRVAEGASGLRAGTLAPAFELADLDPAPDDVEAILAGNVFHRHVVLGEEAPAEDVDLGSIGATVTVNGERTEVADPQGATGEIAALVQHVADLLGHFGQSLRAGDVVICGSVVPPIPVKPGDRVSYELEAVGGLAIAIQGADEGS
jgi:2-keto-4-pentenoate hydratase